MFKEKHLPVLFLLDTTECPKGIEAGTLKLVGADEDTIFKYNRMAKASNFYGDGHVSERIVKAILRHFNKDKQ